MEGKKCGTLVPEEQNNGKLPRFSFYLVCQDLELKKPAT